MTLYLMEGILTIRHYGRGFDTIGTGKDFETIGVGKGFDTIGSGSGLIL